MNVIDTINSYNMLMDITQQKDFLDLFNTNFKHLINHLIEISDFVSAKEKTYQSQIDTLTRQNRALFNENMEIHEKNNDLT